MGDLQIIDQNEYFDEIKRYKCIVLYGAGSKAVQALDVLEHFDISISAVCDNNTERRNQQFAGHTICEFKDVLKANDKKDICVIITAAISNAMAILDGIKTVFDGKIVQLCIPFKTKSRLLWLEELDLNMEQIYEIESYLADDLSKRIYEGCVNYKLTGNMFPLLGYYEEKDLQYTFFDKDVLGDCEGYTLIDIGAYTGDTLISFALFTSGKYGHIEAFEADEGIYKALKDCVRYSRIKNVNLHKQALWSGNGEKKWFTVKDENDVLYDSPNLFRCVDNTVDRITLAKSSDAHIGKEERINVCRLDDYQMKTELEKGKVVMKVNALASDYDILNGGVATIQNYEPDIIIEYGVCPQDLFRMIPFLISIDSKYRFYFRLKNVFGDIKVVMYGKRKRG